MEWYAEQKILFDKTKYRLNIEPRHFSIIPTFIIMGNFYLSICFTTVVNYYLKCSVLLILTPLIKFNSVHYILLLYFYGAIGLFFYIINRTIHGYLQIWNLFRVLNRISHSFALITREISWSTLEINFTFPGIHVLFYV